MRKWQVYVYPVLTGVLCVVLYYLLRTARDAPFEWPVPIGLFVSITGIQFLLYQRAYKKQFES
ncbi:hypothetical protein [Halobacillus sp. A5]|uniref:hypothetical protein n=1 Tax=Halobacillus sp. A5 TaxID=2880263 RepID=UPI0020A62FBF|nr:hypothetical protein [Halobacillus sp. A5]MCP3029160.1 hypothetical protein [Halobacillus sp. A5]